MKYWQLLGSFLVNHVLKKFTHDNVTCNECNIKKVQQERKQHKKSSMKIVRQGKRAT